MRGDDGREGGQRAHEAVTYRCMLDRVLALLGPALSAPGPVRTPCFVDATLGLGGHAEAVLAAHPRLTLVGLDRDTTAIERSAAGSRRYAGRVTPRARRLRRASAASSPTWASPACDGVLFDLGVSSPQLDEAERGFAYSYDAPLDMRMDRDPGAHRRAGGQHLLRSPSSPGSCATTARSGSRGASRTAIVRERARAPLTSTERLVEIVRDAIPAATRRTGGNPGKRTFQALRIEVNAELAALGARAARRPRRAVPSAAAWRSSPTTPSRTASSSGPSPNATTDTTPPGPAGPPAGTPATVPPAHPGRGAPVRRGDHDQPTGRLGTAARGRANP